jgi:hypothetical protein
MALSKGHRDNFNTLERAFKSGRVALLECQDKLTGEKVAVIVALNKAGERIGIVPFAKLFDGNPYEELNPPLPEGGFAADA